MVEIPHLSHALDGHDDVAIKIARVLSDYQALEFMFFDLYRIFANTDQDDAFSTYFSQRSIKRRTDLILAYRENMSNDFQKGLSRLVRRLRGAARRRTEIAHVMPVKGVDGPLRLRLLADGKPTLEALDHEFLNRTKSQYQTLGKDLVVFLTAMTLVQPIVQEILFGPASLPGTGLHGKLASPAPLMPPKEQDLDAHIKRLGINFENPQWIALQVRLNLPSS